MSTITFGGLASGLDSNAIIDKLVSLERLPADALAKRRAAAEKRISILSDIGTKLKSLRSAAQNINEASEVRGLRASTTGSELSVSGGASAQPGQWNVKVNALAQAEVSRSKELNSRGPGTLADGSVTIAVGGGAGVTVTYSATDSLDALATRINDSVAGVNASVLDVGGGKYRLLVSGEEAGALNSIAFTDTGDGLAFSEMQVAQDASVTIAGTTVTRSSNVFSDVIPGVTLSLKAQTPVGGAGSEVTVARDTTAQKTAVQGVVDAYNSAVRALQGQLTYSGVKKGEDTLFGDPSLQALQRKLGIAVASPSPDGTGTVSARDLGLKLNNDGTITLDAAKFETVAAEDPTKVENLFTGEDGLAARLETVVNEMVTFGTGVFATKETSLRTRIRGFDQEIDKIRDAADSLAERLRRQFTQLETVYSSMQTNLGYFSSMLR